MARDQWGEVRHGQKIDGLPAGPWNRLVRDQKGGGPGDGSGGVPEGPVEIRVRNRTGSPVQRFSVLRVAAPTLTYSNDANQFFVRDLLDGTNPTATAAYVITQEPLSANQIGRARLLGLTTAKVSVTNTSHEYADPTTSLTELTSGTTGSARVLWVESDEAGGGRTTGSQWAKVVLLGRPAAAGGIGAPASYYASGALGSGLPGGSISLAIPSAGLYQITALYFGNMQPPGLGVTGGVGFNVNSTFGQLYPPGAPYSGMGPVTIHETDFTCNYSGDYVFFVEATGAGTVSFNMFESGAFIAGTVNAWYTVLKLR